MDRSVGGKLVIDALEHINSYINTNCLVLPKKKVTVCENLEDNCFGSSSTTQSEINYEALFAQIAGGSTSEAKRSIRHSDNFGRRMSRSVVRQGPSINVRRMTLAANTGGRVSLAPKSEAERQTIVMVSLFNDDEDTGNEKNKYRLVVRLISDCSLAKTEARYISSSKTPYVLRDKYFSIECRSKIRSLREHLNILNGNDKLFINDPVFRQSLFRKLNDHRLSKIAENHAALRRNEEKRVKYLLLNNLITPEMLKKQQSFTEKPFIEVLCKTVVFVRNPLSLGLRTLKGYKDFEHANIPRRTRSKTDKWRRKKLSMYDSVTMTKSRAHTSKSSVSTIQDIVVEELSKFTESSTNKILKDTAKDCNKSKRANANYPAISDTAFDRKNKLSFLDRQDKTIENFSKECKMNKIFYMADNIIPEF